MVFYFGACSGGVWKTYDGGAYWENVSDGFFNTAAVGAIAVSVSDPNVVYAGTGEACLRGNVCHGDGVYKSTNGGKTWSHVGLAETRHISRIRIHPEAPDVVYVAALGRAFGPNQERGVYRSSDGGQSWELVLHRSQDAGACDLTMDAINPRVLYAAIWQTLRQPWDFSSGGPDSGLFKSVDGGDTWAEITNNRGMPEGLKGRIGVAASPATSDRVWALVENENGGLFRSDDGGASWDLASDERALQQRPWYYSHVFAHPSDPETVYVLNLKMHKSTDGGRTFNQVITPHADQHDLWIDSSDPRRMIEGNDGGACVSFNEGASWTTIYNQPTSQFYGMTTDEQFPYRLYATQQDNSAISVPSRSNKGAILWNECYTTGSSESGQIAVRPDNPNIVYSGAVGASRGGSGVLLRYDHRTGQVRNISVWPEFSWGWGVKDHKYRFQWTYPVAISPHDPNILYVAANVAFRSENEGTSWDVISPDLTRNDVSKMGPAGGPITKDTTSAEHYGTIFAFVESPHKKGVFWAGSDDGLVHISVDGGESWVDITPAELPEWSLISMIELSPHDPATAYIAATRYKLDDDRPFLYKTNDYGNTWVEIASGIPDHDFTRVIREDPERRGLLYAGTETGVYVSFDDGASWQSLRRNLPVVPVHDMAVKGDELAVATHGRSFWILDDLPLLRQLAAGAPDRDIYLFKPANTYKAALTAESGRPAVEGKNYQPSPGHSAAFYETKRPNGELVRRFLDGGSNPPGGVVVSYYLKDKPEAEAWLTFLDSEGQTIKSFSSQAEESKPPDGRPSELTVPVEAGMNRFTWDMRYPNARRLDIKGADEKALIGPVAPPGAYQVRLTVGEHTQTQTFEVMKDPRVAATQEDLEEQFVFLLRIRDKLTDAHDGTNRLRSVRRQVDEWIQRADAQGSAEAIANVAAGLKDNLAAIEAELINLEALGDLDKISQQARLNTKLWSLTGVVSSAASAPTRQSYEVFDSLSARTDAQLQRLRKVEDTDLARFVNAVHELEIALVAP